LVESNRPTRRFLCAGIAVLDEVFRVKEIPRNDSKTNASAYLSISGGNAANAAIAIAALGGAVRFAGPLGDDDVAERILPGLTRRNIDCTGCVQVAGGKSSVSAILLNDAGERTIATFTDERLLQTAPKNAAALVADADCIVIDNRRPNFVTPICVAGKSRGLPIVMDVDKAAPFDDPLLALSTHIIFSAESLRSGANENDLAQALRQARAKLGQFVAVTDGPGDALWCDGGDIQKMPAFRIDTVDTLAAGDVFHGAFALALVEGQDAAACMRFAAAAAALKCLRFGGSATAPTRAEVEAFLRERSQPR